MLQRRSFTHLGLLLIARVVREERWYLNQWPLVLPRQGRELSRHDVTSIAGASKQQQQQQQQRKGILNSTAACRQHPDT